MEVFEDLSHAELHARLLEAHELIEFWRHHDDGTTQGIEQLFIAVRASHIDLRIRLGQLTERVDALTTAQEQLDADAAATSQALTVSAGTISDLSTHVGNLIAEIASLKSQIAGGIPPQSLDFTNADNAAVQAQTLLSQIQQVDTTAAGADDTQPPAPPADTTDTPPVDTAADQEPAPSA